MLIERKIDFNYNYWFKCEKCRKRNCLLAAEYHNQTTTDSPKCKYCQNDLNANRSDIRLRDEDDPALTDSQVLDSIWYHTSTESEWPKSEYSLPPEEGAHIRERAFKNEPEKTSKYIDFHENQALHIGTYEAALESMLRRMREKDDRDKEFFLYRVKLRKEINIAPELLHDHRDKVGQVLVETLRDGGYQVSRYINVHESPGSISLALMREAIESTQRISIRALESMVEVDDSILQCVLDERHKAQEFSPSRKSASALLDEMLWRRSARDGNQFAEIPSVVHVQLIKMAKELATVYLQDVSITVSENFLSALGTPDAAGDKKSYECWLIRYVNLAKLFTNPERTLESFSSEQWKSVLPQ
ncbi:hypothetical protein HD598_000540 [Neomicrococcus aestuarii]|uniref:Uncharacterized protein n=1 Tax=Neomicrococcus aestuarii TaxID=556325 RepID=A0A7W8TSB0_9MICC|nr:hypothetical protein [Neomicrococcus aestuarii]MBB5511853.1 hypothetical protein [Neomicrococcus aestuarii]